MRTCVLFFLIACCYTLAGCDSDPLVQVDAEELLRVPRTKGFYRETVSLGKAGVLRYTVSMPVLSSRTNVPLVIALHQAGRITPYFGESYLKTQAEPGLRDLRAIIIAPDVPSAAWADARSEEVILALIDAARGVWPVDPSRIVITGYSMGGIGTWYLAGRHPNVFSAGIPIAAEPIVSLQSGAVPLYIIHSRRDELFDVAGVEQAAATLEAQGATVQLVLVDDVSHSQTSGYVASLRGAVRWLQDEVWP